MFFELRQYKTKPGKREGWVKVMEEKIITFHFQRGVTVVGSFIGQDENVYVWVRRFENEGQRDSFAKEISESEYWVKEVRPAINEMLDREAMQVTRLEATAKSVLQ